MNVAEWEMVARNYPCMELKNQKGEPTGVWLTTVARLSFEKLTNPEDGKHSCVLIMPPHADLAVLFDAARRTAGAKWPNANAMKLRSPFKDQKDMADKYDGFAQEGFYINCSSKLAPKFIASDGKSQIPISSDVLWSGCYVRAGLTCYTYEKDAQGKPVTPGVSFGLNFLQFIAPGEKLSGGIDPTEYLTPIQGLPASVMQAPAATGAPNGAGVPSAAPVKPITGALF